MGEEEISFHENNEALPIKIKKNKKKIETLYSFIRLLRKVGLHYHTASSTIPS